MSSDKETADEITHLRGLVEYWKGEHEKWTTTDREQFLEMVIDARTADVGLKVSIHPGKDHQSVDYLEGWFACEQAFRNAMLATVQAEKIRLIRSTK